MERPTAPSLNPPSSRVTPHFYQFITLSHPLHFCLAYKVISDFSQCRRIRLEENFKFNFNLQSNLQNKRGVNLNWYILFLIKYYKFLIANSKFVFKVKIIWFWLLFPSLPHSLNCFEIRFPLNLKCCLITSSKPKREYEKLDQKNYKK